eukprot:14130391-Ditylum_brightwellii.AAC.1
MEMKQWVTTNRRYIKYCLGVCLKQKLMHSADIRNYVETKETTHKRGRLRGAKKNYKGKNKRKNDKRWKQKDIRGTVTDEEQRQPRQRKKTTKVTTVCGDKQNKAGEQSKQRDMIRQTVIKDYYKHRDDIERTECQSAHIGQTT